MAQYQDLNQAPDLIMRDFSKNRNRSLSAEFRYLRSLEQFSCIADYPIMSILVQTVWRMGIKISRKQIYLMMRYSEDMRELPGEGSMGIRETLLRYADLPRIEGTSTAVINAGEQKKKS